MANESSLYSQGAKGPNPSVTDPTRLLTLSSIVTDGTAKKITYTTSSAHNLTTGASVVIYGTGQANFNYNPDVSKYNLAGETSSTTTLGQGTPAVVSAVTSSTAFTVNTATAISATTISNVGYVVNDSLVSNSPWNDMWLPTATDASNAANVQVALEWGDSFPIQPNTQRTAAPGSSNGTAYNATASIANTATSVVANGTTITYQTQNAHNLSAGQWVAIDGVLPSQFSFNSVQLASASGSTFTVLSTASGTYNTSSFGIVQKLNQTNAPVTATTAVGAKAFTVTATSATDKYTYTTKDQTGTAVSHGFVAGQVVNISGLAPAIFNGTVTVVNPSTSTFDVTATGSATGTNYSKAGVVSVQNNTYTTNQNHNLVAGQNISVVNAATSTGTALPDFNVSGLVSGTTATILAVPAPKIALNATTAPSVTGSAVTLTTAGPHGLTTSDKVSVYGLVGGANLNTIGDEAVASKTASAIVLNKPAGFTNLGTVGIASNVVTYTVANTFRPGDVVTVASFAGAGAGVVNVTSVVIDASSSAFKVSAGATSSATLTGTTTATVALTATTASVAIAGVTAVASNSSKDIKLTMPNNFVVGQVVTIAGLATNTGYNQTGVVSAADGASVTIALRTPVADTTAPTTGTANGVTVSTGALVSNEGYIVRQGTGTLASATVANGDYSWSAPFTFGSAQLDPNADNSAIVTSQVNGYPDFTQKLTIPDVTGLSYTNAVQKLRSFGLVGISASTPAAAQAVTAVATTASTVTYTITSTTGINVGDSVFVDNKSGYTTGSQFAVKTATVSAVGSGTVTVLAAGITNSPSFTSGDVTLLPVNSNVTTQSPAASATPAALSTLQVTLTHYAGLGGTAQAGYNG